jgi:hypothetical protein
MADLVSPYVLQDLFLPRAFDDEFADQLVSRAAGGREPFPRKIDLWWTAMMIGVAIGRRTPMPSADKLSKFNTGAIFSRDPWRIANLELVALAEKGESVIADAGEVLAIGNEYAMTGLEWLAEELRGSAQPVLTLMTALEAILPQEH